MKFSIVPLTTFAEARELQDIFAKDDSEASFDDVGHWISLNRSIVLLAKTPRSKIAGVIAITDDTSWEQSVPILLDLFYVLPRYRNNRIGSKLIESALDRVRKDCVLFVIADNEHAKHIYIKYGFKKHSDVYHRGDYGEHTWQMIRHYPKTKVF